MPAKDYESGSVAWWLTFEIRVKSADQHIVDYLAEELCDEIVIWAGERQMGVGGGEWPDVKVGPDGLECWRCQTGIEQHATGIEYLPRAAVEGVYNDVIVPWAIRHGVEARLVGIEPQPDEIEPSEDELAAEARVLSEEAANPRRGWEVLLTVHGERPGRPIQESDLDALLDVVAVWQTLRELNVGAIIGSRIGEELTLDGFDRRECEMSVNRGINLGQAELKASAEELLYVVIPLWAKRHKLWVEGWLREAQTVGEIIREIEAEHPE